MSHLVLNCSLGASRGTLYVKNNSGVVVELMDDVSSIRTSDSMRIESVTIIGTPHFDDYLSSRLTNAKEVTCIGTKGEAVATIFAIAANATNFALVSCELPRQVPTRRQINLALEDCFGACISPPNVIVGLTIHCPLLEPLHSTIARDALVVFLKGVGALKDSSEFDVGFLCPSCMDALESSQSAHFLGLERLSLNGYNLAKILGKGIRSVSIQKCVIRDWVGYQDYLPNKSIRRLDISIDAGETVAEFIDTVVSRMEELVNLVVRDELLDEVDFRTIAALPIRELNIESCGLVLDNVVPVPNVQRLLVTSAQMRLHPELRQIFSSAEIDVTEVM